MQAIGQGEWFFQFQDPLYNKPVQGTTADIKKKALGLLPQRLVGTGAKIIGTVHDEIILEVPDEKAEEAATILKDVMEAAGQRFLNQDLRLPQ